jgi:hypothetical protein
LNAKAARLVKARSHDGAILATAIDDALLAVLPYPCLRAQMNTNRLSPHQ